MPIVEVYARRPRSRALLAEVPAVVAGALGCPPGDVWMYIVDVDAAGSGDDAATCGARVLLRGEPRPDAAIATALEATARSVASVQGEPIEEVWAQWVDLLPGRVFAGGQIR